MRTTTPEGSGPRTGGRHAGPRGSAGRGGPWLRLASAGLAAAAALAASLTGPGCGRAPAGRTLEVLVPFVPSTTDPFADSRLASRSAFTAVFEPLVEETALGTRPAIAESWTTPAPDTWVFRIAPHSTFHDGTPVSSRDVVEAARAARAAPTSVSGLGDLRAIEVVDERTVRFRTHAPSEDFLLAVAALFVPRRVGAAWIGTGPYRVVALTPDRLVLRGHPRPKHPVPLFTEVVFRRFASSGEGVRLLRRQVPSAALDPTPAMVREARADPRYRVDSSESGGLTYLAFGFSAGCGPFEDVRVRRALRLSLDLRELVAASTIAGGLPAARAVPPGAFGFDPEAAPPARDVAAARRLLAEAGYPEGFEATLDVSPPGEAAGHALARQAAAAGIRLHVAVHEPDAFVARIDGRSPLYLYRMFVGSDAGQALRNAFHTRDSRRGLGTLNRTGYSRPELDRLFAELAAATRPERRLGLLREISGAVDDDLPWIPLYSAREARILPAGLDLPRRPDGLFAVGEARLRGVGK